MDIIRILVAVHPRAWRDRYGQEFTALLEDTERTPGVVLDILINAARVHAQAHRHGLDLVTALFVSIGSATVARLTGQAPNILWLPRTITGGLLLAGVLGPVLALAVLFRNRRARPRGEAG